MANHSHIFWSSKVRSGFWEIFMRELSNICGTFRNKIPLILLLGKIPEEIKKKESHLFGVIRVAIIKLVTRNRLKDDNKL